MDLLPPGARFVIVDAGAREVERSRWGLFPPSRLKFIGFEPDVEEATRLNTLPSTDGAERKFIAGGLWGSTGALPFEHNNTGGGSSFLRQNRVVTDRWRFIFGSEPIAARDLMYPVREETMNVVSLVEWAREEGISSVDFFKINIQGGELEVLRGAGDLLDTVLGLDVEVGFVESYVDRPMFSDIDTFLRSRGFTFFDFTEVHYVGRDRSPVSVNHVQSGNQTLHRVIGTRGQIVEGHALYLRDPISNDPDMDDERVIKLAALSEAFGQVEYAFELLNWLVARAGPLSDRLRWIIHQGTQSYSHGMV
jgi:FkbM family methyltransferase